MKSSPRPFATSSASAPLKCLLFLAAPLSFLQGCKTQSPTLPEPPIVSCQQGKTRPVGEPPADWWADGPAWVAEVLGTLRQERALRAAEHECLDRLRAQSIIR